MNKIGILLTNIGTPDAPTKKAVRTYLKQFLTDPRVIELNPFIWKPILLSVILPFRSKKSAKLYQSIWTEKGSPLLNTMRDIADGLEKHLNTLADVEIYVSVGMRYGNPSIQAGLEELRYHNVEHIFVLPLYPQYSATTTASTFDAVAKVLKSWRKIPDLRLLNEYASNESYIHALAESITNHWKTNGKKYLLFSFHGIPQRYVDLGDPYAESCLKTATLVAEKLHLHNDEWSLAFQSRLGPTKWLQPYTDKVLASLPKKGIEHIHVICPGFPVDCLETLEEISIRGKEQFLQAGGKTFGYIPALNNDPLHITALSEIFFQQTKGWF